MTILSDISIESLCTPPSMVFDEDRYDALTARQNILGWPFTGQAVKELREKLKSQALRPATDEEIANFKPMISPFCRDQIKVADNGTRLISAGLTSYGYDVTLADEFKLFININSVEIDPKRPNAKCMVDAVLKYDESTGEKYVSLPPNSYLLGYTVEQFCMPRDVVAICVGKSTYARAGVHVNVTPIEPGFEGTVVLEISNSTNLPVRIYADEGAAQFLFLKGDRPCRVSYADRAGKYQNQSGIQLGKV